ncbi:MAG: hypothetical protein LRY71_00435 [Bacillaceae bacterium]|nr:hypothetical protein [Bacillaceae bacterium]
MSEYESEQIDVKDVHIRKNQFANKSEKDIIIQLHNDIFINTIDHDFFTELTKHEIITHFTAY